MKSKRLFFILLVTFVFLLSTGFLFAGGSKEKPAEPEKPGEKVAPAEKAFGSKLQERIAKREPAKQGEALTPADFPTKFLPGISKPGVVPKKKYFVVYSNGDMNDLWRLNHVKDMEAWGNRYND